MDLKELCVNLAYCESEQGVIKLLEEAGLWDDPEAWHYYGGIENNFATIGNQQSRPESALVEKIINSVDAVLMAESLKRKVDPESKESPRNICDALIEYFRIHDGKLSNIHPRERSQLAGNICLVATGAKTNPCYSIIDKGEGQTPEKMPVTLLSLARSNKLRIPFVQGKFNMGGTGVFQFCGRKNLQLIISKRHPEISKHENDMLKNKWGFTVIRREDPGRGTRSSTYRYLAPRKKILCFDCDSLFLLPGKYPDPYGTKLEWGTYIKLYEYQMTGLKTNVLFDLYNRLSILMPTIALPVRLYERRKGYSGHSFETTLSGLTVRLDEDRRENLEEGFPASIKISAQGQQMTGSIYAFKKGQSEKYTKDEGIIFTVNGQTHAHLSKSFFSRRAVGMGYLDNSLLVTIDCSDLQGRAKEDLFMNSRDRLRAGDLRSEIERDLENQLKNHPGLRELRERRRREEIENKLGDSKPLVEIIENIMKKSPTLSKLFIDGVRITNPFKVTKAKTKKKYEGRKFPTYFTLNQKYSKDNPKNCPINARFRLEYETDAVNDYFDRDSDPGVFSLEMNGEEISKYSLNLWNGRATLYVELPPDSHIGDLLHFKSSINDISRVEPIKEDFYVRIQNETIKRKGRPGKPKPPRSDEEGGKADKVSNLDLPQVIEVRRDNWNDHSFTDESALKVISNGEDGYDFFVNMDNVYLLAEQKSNAIIDSKLLDARYKYGMVLIGIAFLKDYVGGDCNSGDNEEDINSIIASATRIISPVLLPMIASLGDLQLDEVANVYEDN